MSLFILGFRRPQRDSIKLCSDTKATRHLGLSYGKSPRHAQNHLSKTPQILHKRPITHLCRGPVAMLKLPAWKVVDRRFEPHSGLQVSIKQNVSSPLTRKDFLYCGESQWPRGSVLGLRPPGSEFRILSLGGSVISFISPFTGGSPGPVIYVHFVHSRTFCWAYIVYPRSALRGPVGSKVKGTGPG